MLSPLARGMRRPPSLRLLACLVGLSVLVACGQTPPSPSQAGSPLASTAATASASPSAAISQAPISVPPASVDNAAVYAQIEADVQAIRGLRSKSTVTPKVVDRAGISKVITDEVTSGTPPAVQAATERGLKALGLLPPDESLQRLYLQLLTSQTTGLYDPNAKTLYVVSKQGGLGPIERVTFSHEFDHALQDQNFGLQKLQVDAIGEGDRSLARLALPEGDATLLMSLWAQQHLSASDTLELLVGSQDPEQARALVAMPAILRETLLFPYTTGLSFVTGLQRSGGWPGVDAAYATPPASTEQLLHPEKYASHEAVLPVQIPTDLGARLGPGWSVPLVDSLGEFQLRIWLRDVGKMSDVQATSDADGWGGDRLVVANGPAGAWAVAVVTRWDTPDDAAAFGAGAGAAVTNLTDEHEVVEASGGNFLTVVVASNPAALNGLKSNLASLK